MVKEEKIETKEEKGENKKEKGENKNLEYFEMWMKSQQEFSEYCMKVQKELMEGWMQAARMFQGPFSNLGGGQFGNPEKDMLSMYNTWLNTIVNSSKGFTGEAMKIEEPWKSLAEKQMKMGKEMFEKFSNLSSRH